MPVTDEKGALFTLNPEKGITFAKLIRRYPAHYNKSCSDYHQNDIQRNF